jgi:hypothetical protein
MSTDQLNQLCEQGQQRLMATQYWEAEQLLAQAESSAWEARDFDTLSRLYMPLQEARRQRRLRAGEGIVALNLIAEGPADRIDPTHVITNFPQGQLLVAGWGTLEPALRVRELAEQNKLYVETFLAAAYPMGAGKAIAIVPTAGVTLPPPREMSIDELIGRLPAHSVVLAEAELPRESMRGSTETFARVSAMWERLHAPFMAASDMTVDPVARIEAYRRVIRVDYACELAHQKLSDVARRIEQIVPGPHPGPLP